MTYTAKIEFYWRDSMFVCQEVLVENTSRTILVLCYMLLVILLKFFIILDLASLEVIFFMIYSKSNLVVKILFESFRKRPVFGVFRPQAYIKETGNYSSVCRFNVFKKPVEKGEEAVLDIIIEAPVGFGHHLDFNALLTIAEGHEVIGQAVILEITGYLDTVAVKKQKKRVSNKIH